MFVAIKNKLRLVTQKKKKRNKRACLSYSNKASIIINTFQAQRQQRK
jgi:hypothetical protein